MVLRNFFRSTILYFTISMKRLYIIAVILIISMLSVAQTSSVIWQQCLGTDSEYCNEPTSVEKTSSGYMFSIIVCADGPGLTNYHGSADSWIVSTDNVGNILWERCYGGTEGERPQKIIRIDDTHYYLLNDASSTDGDIKNGRSGNFWVVKINESGEILWEYSYGGSTAGEEVRDAILMPDKGLICMGRISSTGGDVTSHYGDMDIWLFRIDSIGNLLWEKTYGNHGRENAIKIKLTSRSTVLLTGCHDESGGMIDCSEPLGNNADVWLVELDLHGSMRNQWCFGGSYWDQGWDITETSDGYVFTALTTSNDGDVSGLHGTPGAIGSCDIWTAKFNFQGNIIWQICSGGSSMETPVYISETIDNNFIIIGQTTSHDGDVTGNHTTEWNEHDIWVIKLSRDGQLIWEHCLGGQGTDRFNWGFHSVLKKDDYNFVIGAISNYASDDVTCDPFPNDLQNHAWLFEIKDCNYYAPGVPSGISGSDTLCTVAEPISSYSTITTQWAAGYEWKLEPENAGTISYIDTTAQITWNKQFEGAVTVSARSFNDCGYSAWSEPFVTQVYSCLGIGEQGSGEAWKHGCVLVWPNPASGIVDFRWSMVDGRGDLSLLIYDLFGREIRRIAVPETGHEIKFSVGNLAPGLYLVVLKDESQKIGSAKMIVSR